jgi:hypothetical protein
MASDRRALVARVYLPSPSKPAAPLRVGAGGCHPDARIFSHTQPERGAVGRRCRILSHSSPLSFRPGAPSPSFVISTRGPIALFCHFDRRPKAAVEKSCREAAVPLWVSRNSRPDLSRSRPEPGPQVHATSMRGEIAEADSPLRFVSRLRCRCAPKKLACRVPWLRSRSHVCSARPACLRERRHGTQNRGTVSSAYPPRCGLGTRNDKPQPPFPAFPIERRHRILTTPAGGVRRLSGCRRKICATTEHGLRASRMAHLMSLEGA